ncbi:hypothetical protein GH714_003714 [Hevea brasiliensis]|uniref:Uncharacterized protein n=1 Tax=Hevea brasiliensis TaxID=3981 RepID=A0A6A6KGF6_HEVBR|nr:hypothetical protein GH714_003714 [Hevea brasiliensis]
MDKNGIVAVFLSVFIVADVSNASLLSTFRRFVTVASTGSSGTNQISPSPSPDPLLNTASNGTSSKDPKVPDDSNKVDSGSKGSLAGPLAGPHPLNNGTTTRNDHKTDSQSEVGQNCTAMTRRVYLELCEIARAVSGLPNHDSITWCLLRKRKQQNGIPYQELEMGLPESSFVNNVETAEGWDEGWDDEWDGENAVKSPRRPFRKYFSQWPYF